MAVELKILSGADEDIRREFARWFQNDKGEQFYNILDQKLELLRSFPLLGQVYIGSYRRLLISEFQLGIYYQAFPQVQVHAILPLRIHPAVINYRLQRD